MDNMNKDEMIKRLTNPKRYPLIDIIRKFKREGIENFIILKKEDFDKLMSKIKWKPIKEYDRKKYDWVLVKYFDGDYECIPEVAEKRSDGKWYTSEKEIPFEVKYFFDMQELLEGTEDEDTRN